MDLHNDYGLDFHEWDFKAEIVKVKWSNIECNGVEKMLHDFCWDNEIPMDVFESFAFVSNSYNGVDALFATGCTYTLYGKRIRCVLIRENEDVILVAEDNEENHSYYYL